jgi:pimeloyl-ACP methyl ester carboxylesterase/DNA-binding CsgD family transcriptional regulator
MRQRFDFLRVGDARVAYATMGDGPVLIFPQPSFGHLGMELESQEIRSFFEALASRFTLVRYDPLGTGMSDRERAPATLTLDFEVDVLEALATELAEDPVRLFGFSYGGVVAASFAARRPERVQRLLLFGAYADGAICSQALLRSVTSLLRADWDLGARMLATAFVPDADRDTAAWFAKLRRESCDGDMAASLLELWARTDLRDVLSQVSAPTLVAHRRRDPVVPMGYGRVLAALIPGAQFDLLEGRWHQPWLGDVPAVLRLASGFFGFPSPVPSVEDGNKPPVNTLTAREREVLQLVAQGLSDVTIAQHLVLSAHTVHRHVANIRTRLGQPSRAAAAALAARSGII